MMLAEKRPHVYHADRFFNLFNSTKSRGVDSLQEPLSSAICLHTPNPQMPHSGQFWPNQFPIILAQGLATYVALGGALN